MYHCDDCDQDFEHPQILRERHGMAGPLAEEVPVCPHCGGSFLIQMVKCSCCGEYTPDRYVQTDDGHIYCINCYVIKEPRW